MSLYKASNKCRKSQGSLIVNFSFITLFIWFFLNVSQLFWLSLLSRYCNPPHSLNLGEQKRKCWDKKGLEVWLLKEKGNLVETRECKHWDMQILVIRVANKEE